jgi:hypothetical protein
MKKLLIILLLLLSANLFAQRQFPGIWTSDNSTYVKSIVASEYAVLGVTNVSFEENHIIPEELIDKNKTVFTTTSENTQNGYTVKITYKYINTDTIKLKYSGDYTGEVMFTKLKQKK